MICYQLLCEHDHEFEAWFRDSTAFDEQAAHGEVQCPFCGNDQIRKAVMSPAVASAKDVQVRTSADQKTAIEAAEKAASDMRSGADPQEAAQTFMEVVSKLQKHVENTCDYVGEDFAEEARAIHSGDAEMRDIYGEATSEETEELRDEGIEVISIPKLADKEQAN
ncbi:conserved hypothetical protein [Candidatus Terasakiella magnetica]|uniref:DUF1178 family protein n=1 Tax=Candidatus Terasakiella magnetica TaxID=1867952 RepID=A0A1C3RFP4_9PROT|nr:DUF1178 family protein [Candidatus Terasakiella magnetica]SCA56075.1 conserved hypothetical protein [Candidatus Terasakiella magnetica]